MARQELYANLDLQIMDDRGSLTMKWDVFISHAGEDKREVARPLADLLTRAGLRVWLDENELRVGDSLRGKIDQGLAGSEYGIVVLSQAFFSKEWPQRELDALASLQSSGRNRILPVWHKIDHELVARHSPLLAGLYAVSTQKGLPSVAKEIVRAVQAPATPAPPSSGRGAQRWWRRRSRVIIAVGLILLSMSLLELYQPSRSLITGFFTAGQSRHPASVRPAVSALNVLGILTDAAAGVGVVKKVVEKGTPPIIIFQEWHNSRLGQIEIATMLNRLYETWGLRHIGQEGVFRSDRPLECTWFHPSLVAGGTLSARDKVAVRLLAEGEISSGELMCLVYPDFGVHGVEQAVEYNIDLSPQRAKEPVLGYLIAIAETSVSPKEAAHAESLMKEGHNNDALRYIMDSNEFTKREFARLETGRDTVERLEAIEAEAKRVGARVSAADQKGIELDKTFLNRAVVRSSTMVESIEELAKKYLARPVALIIGAAHTERVSAALNEANLSFAVVQPESFGKADDPSKLSEAAFDRVSLGRSVDAVGGIGSLLDGRRKPPPVVDKNWIRSKAEAYLLTAEVAGVETPDQPYVSSSFQKKLLQLQYVALVPSSLELRGSDRVFAMRAQVQNLAAPAKIWARAAMIRRASSETLDGALKSALTSFRVIRSRSPVYVTDDVIALFSKDRSAVIKSALPR